MALEGADIAQLRQLAKRFDSSATQLQQLTAQLTASINATQAWQGGDANRFRSDWNGKYRTLITQSTTVLHNGSQTLAKNADEQERASSGTGGSTHGGEGHEDSERAEEGDVLDKIKEAFENSAIWTGRELVARGATLVRSIDQAAAATWSDEKLIQKALAGSKWFTMDTKLSSVIETLEGKNWGELLDGLGTKLSGLVSEGRLADLLGSAGGTLGRAGELLGPVGKALGPIGVGIGAISTFEDFRSGHNVRGVLDGAMTALTVGAMLPDPPADIICGVGAAAIGVGEFVYDHWDGISQGVENAAKDVGHAVDTAAKDVGNVAEDVGKTVSKAMPWNW